MRTSAVALILAVVAVTARQNAPHRRTDIEARHHGIALDKRVPQFPPLFPDDSETTTTTESTSEIQTSTSNTPPPEPPTSTRTSTTPPPPPTSTTSTSEEVEEETSSTSTSTSTSSTSTSSSSSSQPPATAISRSTTNSYRGVTLTAGSGTITNLRGSQSTTTSSSSAPTSSDTPFLQNKTAVAATFTVLGIVAAGGLIFVAFWFYRKSKRGKMAEEDMWDEASMREFHSSSAGAGIAPPTAAVLASEGSGLGRKNTVLPSQSAAAGGLGRSRSNGSPQRRDVIDPDEEPEEILQLPPVANYERPRDSAYDIVPAAPPPASYVTHGGGYGYNNAYGSGSGSGSGGLQAPKRAGDHSSFGSGLGNDPFAGTGFVDATRESTFGPGQAGRGAGYQAQGQSSVGMGNQWPQGYNQNYGYSGGNQTPYGGAYGYAQ